jgi:DNA-cytosine methyltransferase
MNSNKRKRQHHVNTPVVQSAFSRSNDETFTPVTIRADDSRAPVVTEVAIFHSEGADRLGWIDELKDGTYRGKLIIPDSETFMRPKGRYFVTSEFVYDSNPKLAVPQPKLEYFISKDQRRIERVGAPSLPQPDVGVGARIVLPAGTWKDDEVRLKKKERRDRANEDLLAKQSNPELYPYARLRNAYASAAGEHDVEAYACLGIVVEPGKVRKMKRGTKENELIWTEEIVSFVPSTVMTNFGEDDFWWEGMEKSNAPPAQRANLKTLDIFAGCGGLMQGLVQSGVCSDGWAIEFMKEACESYKANYPDSVVYNEDCNDVLEKILAGEEGYPKKGQVQAIVGGPPCQGFSTMNRFKGSEKYNMRNSLVSTFLSFCEYYQPQLILIENVPTFISMDKGTVLQSTVEALLDLNYQVTFDVLQAGHYGAPQSRKRFILIAVPYHCALPVHPVPTHSFGNWKSGRSIVCNSTKFVLAKPDGWAHPPLTLRDAIGDLNTNDGTYSSPPQTDYQRRIRLGASDVPDFHTPKLIPAIHRARIQRLPVNSAGADWRDLPDEEGVDLGDGTFSTRLKRKPDGMVTDDNQKLSMIPWSAAHTAHRNSNWPSVYGRLQWDGFFPTTITELCPTSKQGAVIHPEQHRYITMRELARSQGFPDAYVVKGPITTKNVQIGNAVPIPLARAIGLAMNACFINE